MGILHVLNLDLLMSMYFEILFLKLDRFPGLLKLLDKNDFEVNSTIPKHKNTFQGWESLQRVLKKCENKCPEGQVECL